MKGIWLLVGLLLVAGCESVGHVGMITRKGVDPAAAFAKGARVTELGAAGAEACRFFILGVAPFGESDVETAVKEALKTSGGDALVDATVSSNLYGFMPIYNLFCYTCTTVKGTAVKFEYPASAIAP